ncbi:iron ABC transporter permease [Paracoccus sp. M683]|uniref:FecCD family ABC transporter permease n=1 Tax=Paracoccus sp. M683 TaxID=2594268 RepID=UPI00117FC2D4|nr:iron ABC transporter permease [Paracoccus sp. M683]TRW99382.1 iron ABC transporter permease [Paracoccus sp. M683]
MRQARSLGLGLGFGLMTLVLALACLRAGMGPRPVAPGEVMRALLAFDAQNFDHQVIWRLRLARIAAALVVGTALGISGLILQALLRNPLAEPHVLGLNAGAALAVVLASSLPAALRPGLGMTLIAACGAGMAFALVMLLASAGRTGVTLAKVTFCGIAVSALAGALTSTILILNEETLAEMRVWLAGDLAGAGFDRLIAALPLLVAGLAAAIWLGPKLNALALGDATAKALGVPLGWSRAVGLAGTAALCGVAVSIAGPIGFVGLVVPGLARRLARGDLLRALPLAALLGAALLLAADIAAGLPGTSHEMATGLMTALVGAPVFIAIVLRVIR